MPLRCRSLPLSLRSLPFNSRLFPIGPDFQIDIDRERIVAQWNGGITSCFYIWNDEGANGKKGERLVTSDRINNITVYGSLSPVRLFLPSYCPCHENVYSLFSSTYYMASHCVTLWDMDPEGLFWDRSNYTWECGWRPQIAENGGAWGHMISWYITWLTGKISQQKCCRSTGLHWELIAYIGHLYTIDPPYTVAIWHDSVHSATITIIKLQWGWHSRTTPHTPP